VFGIIGLIISVFASYWVIRWAVFGGMVDFEKWKNKRDGDRYGQYGQYDEQA
jgi:hypothetical protein